jgi:hypothetical protein
MRGWRGVGGHCARCRGPRPIPHVSRGTAAESRTAPQGINFGGSYLPMRSKLRPSAPDGGHRPRPSGALAAAAREPNLRGRGWPGRRSNRLVIPRSLCGRDGSARELSRRSAESKRALAAARPPGLGANVQSARSARASACAETRAQRHAPKKRPYCAVDSNLPRPARPALPFETCTQSHWLATRLPAAALRASKVVWVARLPPAGHAAQFSFVCGVPCVVCVPC